MNPATELQWKVEAGTGLNCPSLVLVNPGVIPRGRLTLQVKNVRGLYQTQLIGKQEPFLDVTIGQQTQRIEKEGSSSSFSSPYSFTLEGWEDYLYLDVYARNSLSEDAPIGGAKIPVPLLLHLSHPILGSPSRQGYKAPPLMSAQAKSELKEMIDNVTKAQLPDIIKSELLSILNEAKSKNPFHEAWFSIVRTENLLPAGEIQLRLQFIPDYTSPPGKAPEFMEDHIGAAAGVSSKDKDMKKKIKSFASKVQQGSAKVAQKVGSAVQSGMQASMQAAKAAYHEIQEQMGGEEELKAGQRPPMAYVVKPKAGKFFGATLQEALLRAGTNIPPPCADVAELIRAKGLETEGIFRVPGNNSNIQQLKASYESEESVLLDDVHDAGGVFKLYIRELPEPLILMTLYKSFIQGPEELGGMPAKIKQLKNLISMLPQENHDLLAYLCQFLHEISEKSEINKMDAKNLAIVFAPNVLRPEVEDSASLIADTPLKNRCFAILIEESKQIFPTKVVATRRKPGGGSNSSLSPTASNSATPTLTRPVQPVPPRRMSSSDGRRPPLPSTSPTASDDILGINNFSSSSAPPLPGSLPPPPPPPTSSSSSSSSSYPTGISSPLPPPPPPSSSPPNSNNPIPPPKPNFRNSFNQFENSPVRSASPSVFQPRSSGMNFAVPPPPGGGPPGGPAGRKPPPPQPPTGVSSKKQLKGIGDV